MADVTWPEPAWKRRLEIAVADLGEEGRAQPHWTDTNVPNCDDACQYHDGKRCKLMGFRARGICEPLVIEMAALLSEDSDV